MVDRLIRREESPTSAMSGEIELVKVRCRVAGEGGLAGKPESSRNRSGVGALLRELDLESDRLRDVKAEGVSCCGDGGRE